ncbi:squamosa promoter-binding-like protein 18 [Phoenix dactylifera]|uniref:Squamosa promoter-binding-like protein 18 n=1 Tax=Phoenix dactylifera TaxID=42345 RepID=A0A8B9AZK9_PHODC|nr:squamosa promoter-binding-like protein 18 [Phoenix dactylifera]XP_038989303.1 squamosa promoter-binding-like protein 18 [Phoenix dactylifera]
MDWDSKISPWDLPELEQHAEPNIGSVVGSSGSLGRSLTGGVECSVDLKLGGLGEFRPSDRWKEQLPISSPVSSSRSSKRARAPSGAAQNVSCLVDGCKSDLSNCRDYHRRHKVCEVHSKTPMVMVGGQEQRFCQQCSRFHLLVEFDEVKRSCRKRLDGHNRRRRKPQQESINSGSMLPNHHVTRFSAYPQIFPTATPETNWAGIVKSKEDALYAHYPLLHCMDRQQQLGSFPRSFKEGKQFSFMQDSDTAFSSRATLEPSICRPLKTNSLAEGSSSSSKFFSDRLTQVLDSECALSLLSSPTQTSGVNVGQMVPADRIPMGQPLVSTIQYSDLGRYSGSQASNSVSPTGFSCSGIDDEHVATVLVSDANDAHLHCQSIFHVGGEGPSSSQALPFSWQ